MKLQVFAVRDSATESYGNPMFLIAAGQAIRSFSDEVNRAEKDNPLHAHPDDYELFWLGSFDTNTGLFETFAPDRLARAKDVLVSIQ